MFYDLDDEFQDQILFSYHPLMHMPCIVHTNLYNQKCVVWFINNLYIYSYTMYRRNIDIFFVILAPVRDFDKLANVRSCIARDVLVDYKKIHVKTKTN